MTESRLAAILAEETPPFWRRPVAPRRRRRRPVAALARRVALRMMYLLPLLLFAWWVLTSPAFEVVEVDVAGSERVAGAWIDQQLLSTHGENLVLLRIDGVREALMDHPFVAGVRVRKDLPGRLIVEIEEHQAAAVLTLEERGFLVTRDGLVFSRIDLSDESSLLRIMVEDEILARQIEEAGDALIGTAPEAVRSALRMHSEVAEVGVRWRLGLREIGILGRDDFELRFDRYPGSVLVDSKSARSKVLVLDWLLPQLARRYSVESFDLRFGSRIVLRGAADLHEGLEAETSVQQVESEGA